MEKEYISQLTAPTPDARGYTRWWWYGCNVEKAEIDRELDFMHRAGIGGVELQILYPVTPDDPAKGDYNIPFGSPEFYEILAYTQKACQKRGMVMDFTPGSSWPYGGPFISEEDAQQEAIPYQIDIHGPCDYACDFTTRFAGTVVAAVMGKMEHCRMLPETVVDITDRFCERMLFGWPWGTELKTVSIPEGDWKLCFYVISMHHNRVGKPGRDAAGMVMDHCSRRAMDCFLDNMVQPVCSRVPGIHTLFCDSIEVEGHNWSGVLLTEFAKRRGYDLKPYIYALWGDMGEITPRVRYDYFKTMSELTIENFFDPLTAFAHKNGALSRIQAHGTWGDILRVYAAADIPEGETFGDHRTLEVNTIHRRLAASAGHIYGRPIISNETFTWLKRPRFTETLEEMKSAVDAVFLDGMNQIVNHGYAYSPEKAGRRGWPFYASTHINHTVPWWPYYHNLAEYIHRVSALLRQGIPVREVGIYLPQADVYADNMLSELHLAMRLEEHLGRENMDAIQKAGYWFDYLNDQALTEIGSVGDGCLRVGENGYRAIILVNCTRMPGATAKALAAFVQSGGILIALPEAPYRGCGLLEYAAESETVQACMAAARPVIAYSIPDLIAKLGSLLAPQVTVSAPDTVGYLQRRVGGDNLYFLSNLSDDAKTVQLTFRDRTEGVQVFDLNSNKRLPYLRQGEQLTVCFEPHGSVLCAFSPDFALSDPVWQRKKAQELLPRVKELMTLTGWQLTVPEQGSSWQLQNDPTGWQSLPGMAHYSGEGQYTCQFTLPQGMPLQGVQLRLSGLSAAASVSLNGVKMGEIWTHPYTLPLTALRQGSNTLTVQVASTLVNEMMQDDGYHPVPAQLPGWPYYGKVINDQRTARLNTRREYTEQKQPLASGLWGEVRLEQLLP